MIPRGQNCGPKFRPRMLFVENSIKNRLINSLGSPPLAMVYFFRKCTLFRNIFNSENCFFFLFVAARCASRRCDVRSLFVVAFIKLSIRL